MRVADLLPVFSQFARSYKDEPKFMITWLNYIAHDDVSALYSVDDQVEEWLAFLFRANNFQFFRLFASLKDELENSFVFLLGDHGLCASRGER